MLHFGDGLALLVYILDPVAVKDSQAQYRIPRSPLPVNFSLT